MDFHSDAILLNAPYPIVLSGCYELTYVNETTTKKTKQKQRNAKKVHWICVQRIHFRFFFFFFWFVFFFVRVLLAFWLDFYFNLMWIFFALVFLIGKWFASPSSAHNIPKFPFLFIYRMEIVSFLKNFLFYIWGQLGPMDASRERKQV